MSIGARARSRILGVVVATGLISPALGLGLTSPAQAAESIALSPTSGPVGTAVTIQGSGWDAGTGLTVQWNCGWSSTDRRAIAKVTTDSGGRWSASGAVPNNCTTQGSEVWVEALGGPHGSPAGVFNLTSVPPATNHPPQIIPPVETFTDGVMVWVRVHYQDPDGNTAGFGFHGAKGSGWAEETHPFSSPSYGRAIPAGIEYPFNHECGRPGQYESDIEFWVYDATGLRSASVIVHLACSTPPVPQPVGTPTQPPLAAGNYVALGDSYSSGEGLSPYVWASDLPLIDQCHRSVKAYGPNLVTHDTSAKLNLGAYDRGILGTDYTGFVACSGAVTADISNPNHNNQEPAQIKALSASTNVVTLTIGGNDTGFVQMLISCIHKPIVGGGYGCSQSLPLVSQTNSLIAELEGTDLGVKVPDVGTTVVSIANVIDQIKGKAPNAHIYIAGYPILFGKTDFTLVKNHEPAQYIGDVGYGGTIDRSDAQWIDGRILKVNELIKKAASSSKGVTYVDATTTFNGHGLLDSKTPWINKVVLNLQQPGCDWRVPGGIQPWSLSSCLDPGSFHPTDTGQLNGYEAAFQKLVK